ncbi:MAG: lipid-A-disaccharide synthase [Muribaculaceae bacterium]|nr:lipid-A-disaccharide synthase [Muribaculaceae bacterium]
MKPEVAIIAAVADDGAIGRDGSLLCHLPEDLRRFKAITMGHTVVMGRRTFESLPKGPLPGRENIVVTRNETYDPGYDGVRVAHSLEQAMTMATMPSPVMVIGGGEIYRQALPMASTLHLTRIHATFPDADTWFPEIDPNEWQIVGQAVNNVEQGVDYEFVTLERKETKVPIVGPGLGLAAQGEAPRYLILAGEASGDLHGSHLIAELRRLQPEAQVRFFGGDMMAAAAGRNPEVHYRDMAFMGFVEVIKHLPAILGFMRTAKKIIDDWQPTAVILIDYPSFNLKIAKHAAGRGIPVHYFISPKVWVWKQWRVKDIKRYVKAVYCILPFEPEFYRGKGYGGATYVGNPTVAEVEQAVAAMPTRDEFCATHGLDPAKPIIAILPGSRLKEIRDNLPSMLQAAARHPDCQAVIAAAPSVDRDIYRDILNNVAPGLGLAVPIVGGLTFTLVRHARVALVTSGTATLETALLGTPQVACYRMDASRVAYWFYSKLLSGKYVTLPNLIADEPIIPELLMHHCTVDAIDDHLTALLLDGPDRSAQLDGYARVAARLTTASCATTTARLLTTNE